MTLSSFGLRTILSIKYQNQKMKNHFISNSSLNNSDTQIKLTGKFVKDKRKGTNPAIGGNPVNMYAVTGN